MTKKRTDITPVDSAVPVYLEEWTDKERAEVAAANEQFTAETAARENVRKSALKKLENLGLTEDEVKAVLGGY